MKKKDLYKIIKQSLKEVLKEQLKSKLPLKPNKTTDVGDNVDMAMACSETQSYGEITIYNSQDNQSGECVGQTINDKFICCSGNNPNSNIANGSYTIETPYGQITVPASGNVNCFPNNNITNNQFTFAQFSSWFMETMGAPLCESSPGVGDGYMVCPGENFGCNTQVGGCPHPLSVGTEYPAQYNPDSQGCLDESDNLIGNGMDISCCQFQGCGAVDATPQALNVSYDLYPAVGDFSAVTINEDAPYWVDDSSCQFPSICTEEFVTIDNVQYNSSNYSSVDTVQNSPNYTTYVGGGLCQVGVCTDTNLQNPVDNLGNVYNSEGYPGYVTGFVITMGTYDTFQVTADLSECTITACTDSSFDNYYDPNDENNWGFGINPDYTIISNNELCANATISGCTDSTACNYNSEADADDASCTYPETGFDCDGVEIPIPGCMNDLSNPIGTVGVYNPLATEDDLSCVFNYCLDSTAENYVCTLYSTELCNGGTEYDNTLGNWTLGENNLGTGCEYAVVGCMDDTQNIPSPLNGDNTSYMATNYNQLATVECDGTNSGGDTNLECTEGIDGTLQTIETNPKGCCCNYVVGCMEVNALNYNPAATVDQGCIDAVSGCTSPGFDNYNSSATVDDGTCKVEGCMWEVELGLSTDSPFSDFVCLEYDEPITGPSPLNPNETITLQKSEWLCHCGNHPYAINDCSISSIPQFDLGTFIDPGVYNSSTGQNDYSMGDGTPDSEIWGLCGVLASLEGCNNNGSPTYFQNDGTGPVEVEVGNYIANANDDGSCQYSGCPDPFASNYFCVDNPNLCTTDPNMFAIGCMDPTVPGNYPDDLPTCLSTEFGENINTATYGCVYPETYNCGTNGCIDDGDGRGEYSTLAQCEANCTACSTVQVETCQGTFNKTFDCLYIDGEMGDPDCNTSGLYCVGQEFSINEFSGYGTPFTGTTTDSQGAAVDIARPKPNEKFSKRTYRVLSIMNQNLDVPKQQGTSTTCSELGNERPLDPERPIGSNWCGTDIDMDGNDAFNPQAKVTIDCCSPEGYPVPYTMLNSVYQSLCAVSGVLNPLSHLEYCEERTGGTYGIPPCGYAPPVDPDRDERPPDEPMPDDPDFYGGEFGSGPGSNVIVDGCTDNNAYNYNPSANNDDGSCIYMDSDDDSGFDPNNTYTSYGGDGGFPLGQFEESHQSKLNKLRKIIREIIKSQK